MKKNVENYHMFSVIKFKLLPASTVTISSAFLSSMALAAHSVASVIIDQFNKVPLKSLVLMYLHISHSVSAESSHENLSDHLECRNFESNNPLYDGISTWSIQNFVPENSWMFSPSDWDEVGEPPVSRQFSGAQDCSLVSTLTSWISNGGRPNYHLSKVNGVVLAEGDVFFGGVAIAVRSAVCVPASSSISEVLYSTLPVEDGVAGIDVPVYHGLLGALSRGPNGFEYKAALTMMHRVSGYDCASFNGTDNGVSVSLISKLLDVASIAVVSNYLGVNDDHAYVLRTNGDSGGVVLDTIIDGRDSIYTSLFELVERGVWFNFAFENGIPDRARINYVIEGNAPLADAFYNNDFTVMCRLMDELSGEELMSSLCEPEEGTYLQTMAPLRALYSSFYNRDSEILLLDYFGSREDVDLAKLIMTDFGDGVNALMSSLSKGSLEIPLALQARGELTGPVVEQLIEGADYFLTLFSGYNPLRSEYPIDALDMIAQRIIDVAMPADLVSFALSFFSSNNPLAIYNGVMFGFISLDVLRMPYSESVTVAEYFAVRRPDRLRIAIDSIHDFYETPIEQMGDVVHEEL